MDTQLRNLQLTQLEILHVFDAFCREHGLEYSLYAGSLLGAVRHQGFIPWDDDLDVCMSRSDYEKFLQLWEGHPREGYLLQNKENTPGFTQSFSKLRKEHTTYLQYDWERDRYHTGIFLDIFPIDRIPKGKGRRAVFEARCMVYQLMTREFVPPKGNALVRLGAKVILVCVPKSARAKLRKRLLRRITKCRDDAALKTVFIETMGTLGTAYPADLADSFIELPFEDGRFLCVEKWHEYLTGKFGNYMDLPPEEDRAWKHHPIIIDFEYNYEELQYERS